MSPRTFSLFAAAAVLPLASLGCVVRARPLTYSASADIYYEEPAPASGEVVIVRQAPPPVRVEDPGRPPGGGYVWVSGRWVFTSNGWVWRAGHWARARAGYGWAPGHWVRRHDQYVYVPGHWERR